MDVKAYAKINLTLDIVGKRAGGYHLLDSVMQRISLFDRISLSFNPAGEISLRTNLRDLPLDERNTAYRAAALFYQETGIQGGVNIVLQKWIPVQAGMGGGSTDAAAVLCAMNKLYRVGLSQRKLMDLGVKIGADVPFCIAGGTCRCTGIGEEITRVDRIPDCYLVLCKPTIGVDTASAYSMIDRYARDHKQYTPGMLTALKSRDIKAVSGALNNAFDSMIQLVEVEHIKKKMLQSGALGAMLTGSGSTVYGIFDDPAQAKSCLISLRENGKVFIARPVHM